MAGPGNINIKVGADTGEAVRELDALGRPLDQVQSKSQKMGAGIKAATLPAIAVLGAVAVAGKKAADAASNLNESQNAVNVVFGKSAGIVSNFAKVADKEAGLSMRALNEAVTPIGANLINAGFGADQAATASVNLAKRAADMASVFNTDVSTALEAISSGLRGEADPLEKFGVGLSAAAVQSKAMALGLAESTGALTAQDLAQARLALIMEQTSKLQGDFVRTSGEAANASRVNAAAAENTAASFGQALLPVINLYQSALRAVIGLLAEHRTATMIVVGAVTALAAIVLVARAGMMAYQAALIIARAAAAVFTAGQWLLNAALTANPVGIVVVAIAALAAGIYIAYTRSETFRSAISTLWGIIRNSPLGLLVRSADDVARAIGAAAGAVADLVAWIGRIKFPSPPSWLGKLGGLNPFDAARPAPVAGLRPAYAGGPIGAPLRSALALPRSSGGSGGSITINVQGAIDPEGTARAIERVLAGHRRRQGR